MRGVHRVQRLTIESGQSLSDAASLGGYGPVGIVLPPSWTAADVTLQGQAAVGGEYADLTLDGEELTLPGGAAHAVQFSAATRRTLRGLQALKLRSGTSGTPVNQGGARSIELVLSGVQLRRRPSAAVVAGPTVPDAPTLSSPTPGDGKLTINGTLGDDGGSAIIALQYRVDGGAWTDSGGLTFPFDVTLSNGVEYDIETRTQNGVGFSDPSNLVSGTPVAEGPAEPPAFSNYTDCWAAIYAYLIGANEASTYAIDEWTDLSGNDDHPAQATGSAQPTLDFNGVWEVVFGGDDFLVKSSLSSGTHNRPWHMFCAFRTTAAASLQGILDTQSNGATLLGVQGSGQFGQYFSGWHDIGAADTDPHYITLLARAVGNTVYRLDGVETGAEAIGGAPNEYEIDRLVVGAYTPGGSFPLTGAIRGFRLAPEQNDTNRDAMEAYMAGVNTP